jgi:hypothetical protein
MSISKKRRERREFRYQRNIKKEEDHKKEAWDRGKLIEENHNQGSYSADYTIELTKRLVKYIGEELVISNSSDRPSDRFIIGFRKYKIKIQDLILHWNPGVPKNDSYEMMKTLLETYWDEVVANKNPDSLLNTVKYYDK